MARSPSETDFTVSVEGVGNFAFARRRMKDEIAIQVEYARIIDGVEPTAWLQTIAGWLSAFKVLMVRSPTGWSIDEMDPTEDESYRKMSLVHAALIDKERSFRRGPEPTSEAGSQGATGNG